MALPASGQISMGDVNVELGLARATANTALGQASFRTLSGVAAGQIRLGADFYGKSNTSFSAANETFGATSVSPASSSAGITYTTTGTTSRTRTNVPGNDAGTNWYGTTGAGTGTGKYVKATLSSGDSPSGSALSTWLEITSNRSWTLTATAGLAKSCVLSVAFSNDGGATTARTVTVTMSCESIV